MHGSARQTSPQSMTPAIAPSAMSTWRRWRSPWASTSSPDEGGSASRKRGCARRQAAGSRASSSRRCARFSRARGTRTSMSARRLKSTGSALSGSTTARVAGACSTRRKRPELRRRSVMRSSSERARRRPARPPAGADARRTATGIARSESRRASAPAPRTGRSGATRGRMASSRSTPGNRDRPARETERPLLVDDPDRVVPALPEEANRAACELRELLGQERAHERLVDRDLGVPLRHRATLPAPLLCEAAARALAARDPRARPPRLRGHLGPRRGHSGHRADGVHGGGARCSASKRSAWSTRPRPASRSRSSRRPRWPSCCSRTPRGSTCAR